MFKMIVLWLLLSAALAAGIAGWRSLAGQEQWQLTKTVAFATICSLVAVVLLGVFVAVF
jgi:hypothetical protein